MGKRYGQLRVEERFDGFPWLWARCLPYHRLGVGNMAIETVNIPLDPETAKAYKSARAEDKKKMQAVLGLWLRDLATSDPSTLKAVMNQVSRKARARGLTPEVLESLLN